MGYSTYMYAGPVVLISTEAVQQTDLMTSCSNPKCVLHGTLMYEPFCHKCGSPVRSNVETSREVVPDWYDFVYSTDERTEKYEDVLFSPEFAQKIRGMTVCMDNTGGYSFDEDDEGVSLLEPDLNPADALAAFKEKHAELIAEMVEYFGEDNVECDVVVLCYAL